jgi:hypothetical protein
MTAPHRSPLIAIASTIAIYVSLTSCARFNEVQYSRSQEYQFREKTIGLLVVLEGPEQKALDDGRIVRRSMAEEASEGYAADPIMLGGNPLRGEFGNLVPPSNVRNLTDELEHSNYDGGKVVADIAANTADVMIEHGFQVEIIPVPNGDFALSESASLARERGCDLLAVEIVKLARSWNVEQRYHAGSSSTLSSSLRWQQQNGGLAMVGMTMFDLVTGSIVWEHDRREINASRIGPVLGEIYSMNVANSRFPRRPSEYQNWLYKQSAKRAVHMLFATDSPRFHWFPLSTDSLVQTRQRQRYNVGDFVFAQPASESSIWHLAEVVTDDVEAALKVRWMQNMWEPHARETKVERIATVPATTWPSIVWVRHKKNLDYSAYRFERYDKRNGYVYVSRAGDVSQQTFLIGRVGIIPTWQDDSFE